MESYYYHNPGAILRRMFPKQLNTQGLIVIWAVVFILNIVVVVLIQNFAIYKITDVSKEGLAKVSYFKNCEVQEVEEILGDSKHPDIYCVTYVNENAETRLVCLEACPGSVFERFHVKASTDSVLTENGMVQYQDGKEMIHLSRNEYVELANPESMIYMLLQTNSVQKLAGIYIAFGVVMLGIEFFLYSVFHRLFRE